MVRKRRRPTRKSWFVLAVVATAILSGVPALRQMALEMLTGYLSSETSDSQK